MKYCLYALIVLTIVSLAGCSNSSNMRLYKEIPVKETSSSDVGSNNSERRYDEDLNEEYNADYSGSDELYNEDLDALLGLPKTSEE